jgi:DinB family protein
MYNTTELAAVTVSEFRRGLEGLTAEEARVRHRKADGSTMNAISWIVAHVAAQWDNAQAYALGREAGLLRPASDGTPPPFDDALVRFDAATGWLGWIAATGDMRMSRRHEERPYTAGTFLLRAVMHTWFHCGEINAIRQLLGHPEIAFVGPFEEGELEWVAEERPEA